MQKIENRSIKKESFMQGVLALMFSQVLIKILGLVYKLYLTNKDGFGDEGNAIYSGGFQIYALLLTLSSTGVPNAISKLVSERTAIGDERGAYRIFKIAFATFAIIGLFGSACLFLGAHTIANNFLSIPDSEYTLMALSPSIFFVAISSVIRGFFNGKQNMKVTARSQTLEQLFKTVLTVIMVEIIGAISLKNTKLMAAGANLATTLATFLSFSYLFAFYKLRKEKNTYTRANTKEEGLGKVIKRILSVSIPISLSSLMSAINKNIDSFTVVKSLKSFMSDKEARLQYGILSGKVDTLTSLPLSFNIAFATALVPAISAAIAKGDKSTIQRRISFSLLVTMLIGLPCTVGMIVFAQPILNLLFPNANAGAQLLQISSLTIIFTVLVQTINGALQGIGKVMIPATAFGCGVIAKLIINLIFVRIPQFGANAAAWGSVVCHIISFIIGFTVLIKNIDLKLGFKKFIAKPILATLIMSICSYAIYVLLNSFYIKERIATMVALVVAVIMYLLSIIVLKILSEEEINMLPQGKKVYSLLCKMRVYKVH